MKMLTRTATTLCLSTALLLPTFSAQAAMITNDQLLASQQTADERARLAQWLNRDELQQQLAEQGVDMATARSRIAALTDAEVAQMNQQLDNLPAGQGILGLAATIFVVFIITDAIGATDVFTFVKPVR